MGNCNWKYVTSPGGGKIAINRASGFIREDGSSRTGGSGGGIGNIPDAIKAKVQKVRDMAKRSPYGDLEGDIKVSRDNDGNYNLSFTQVRYYGRIKSDTIGVGDVPARKEITRTTRVMDSMGRKINIIRKTETEYASSAKRKRSNAT